MGLPLFGADSLFDDTTVLKTVTSEASGFPRTNLSDDRAFTVYKPMVTVVDPIDIKTDAGVSNTNDVDYFGLTFHDLFTQGATVTFASSADDISYTTIFTVTLADDKIILRTFTKVTARFFRLRISGHGTNQFSIGQIQWGLKVELPFGIEVGFDPLAEQVRMRHTRSQTGNILGSVSTFSERTAGINVTRVPSSFVTGTSTGDFGDFWDDHASQGKPFFWAWNADNPGDFEKNSFFAVIANDARIGRPLVTSLDVGFRDIRFDIVGLKE